MALLKSRMTQTLKLILFFLSLSAIELLAQQPFVCNGDYYLTSTSGNTTVYKVEIDANGDATFNALPNNVGLVVNAIGYRTADNFIYSINTNNNNLYRIDATGNGTFIASLNLPNTHSYYGADFTADGKYMVFIGTNFSSSNLLVFVDFEAGGFPTTTLNITGAANTQITDIAFNPITNLLYGYDSDGDRMIIIDPDTGEMTTGFPGNQVASRIGAVFFDSFGELYGYGGANGAVLYEIDPVSGIVSVAANGPSSSNKDGCSCPYTVRLNKLVEPLETTPCTEVTYYFAIANVSSVTQTGVTLEDQLPPDLLIIEILDNPYGGDIISGVNTDLLSISNMVIPPGFDTLAIRVEVSEDAVGIYKNQARLENVPLLLSQTMVSDNPLTSATNDSTVLNVVGLEEPLSIDEYGICFSETLILESDQVASDYLWNTGETSQAIEVDEAGFYWVDISNDCQTIRDSFEVIVSDEFFVFLPNDEVIDLGEQIFVNANQTSNNPVTYSWAESGEDGILNCNDCEGQTILPLRDVWLNVEVRDIYNCVASDSMFIQVIPNYNIYVPNIFSPNQDGFNDIFSIYGTEGTKVKVFKIFDRWGSLLHESYDGYVNSFDHGWNGIYKGQLLNDAVFAWYAEVEFLDGETKLLKGDITLIR